MDFRKTLYVVLMALGLNAGARSASDMTPGQWLEAHNTQIISSSPNYPDYADLGAFGKAIGDARIVLIGEQSHGEGNVFELKNRIVQYLHKKKGFDVLLIESGMFDGTALWNYAQAGGKVAELAPDRIFYMYSRTREGRGVLEYVDSQRTGKRPLILTSYDTPHAGLESVNNLLPSLQAFLALRHSPALADPRWNAFVRAAQAVVADNFNGPPSDADKQALIDLTPSVLAELDDSVAASGRMFESPGFWRAQVASIRAAASEQWQISIGNVPYWAARDQQAAENVAWLAEKFYTGKKLIVWAHNFHAGKFWGMTLGDFVVQHFGPEQIYSAGFVGYSGQMRDMDNTTVLDVPPPKAGLIEAEWRVAGLPMAFIDFKQQKKKPDWMSSIAARPFNYQDVDWPIFNAFDGLFYIDQPVPATPVP
ncbi:putative hydrolase YbfO [Jeongeupia chitinilytica]|uniref:Hydrolase YbfO n=2 Tax=Jeongeupia chitinilytica TaxID=1041641 RepID=A0ABQ3GWB1_9NEIS|nr:putative hydrolase YbfO [Jeongeupia chitinilytica]